LADPRLKAESAYVAGKFLGSKAYEFDGDATVRDLRQSLLEHRRCGDLTKNDARSIWDWIEENDLDLAESSDPFVSRMQECYREADWQDAKAGRPEWDTGPGQGARDFLAEPWDRIATTLNRQFVGFWRKLWPHFAAKLRDELATGQEGE
jgi:hypothetical protein